MTLTNINSNKVDSITTKMIDATTERILVRHNNITEIPSWLNNYKQILELDVCCNKIVSIPRLEYVTKLNLSNNALTDVALDMPALEHLSLTNNQIVSIDLSKLTKLKNLDIAFNHLTKLDLTKLPKSLKVLRVGANKLKTIPDLGDFIHLTILSIESMDFVEVNKTTVNTTANIFF